MIALLDRVRSRTLWVSPINSPGRLLVFLATTTSTGFYSQRLWGFISPYCFLCGLSCSPVVPPGLSAQMWDHLVCQPPPCCESSPSLLLVWMNVSSLTAWLPDFHTVRFSVCSVRCYGYFLFWNLLSFWLCDEAKCFYLRLCVGWKSLLFKFSKFNYKCLPNSKFHTGEGRKEERKRGCMLTPSSQFKRKTSSQSKNWPKTQIID